MIKCTALLALAGMLVLGVPNTPAPTAGSWRVDTGHSDAQLITDATTDYGKTKIDVTLGFARIRGRVNLDDADPTKSSVDLTLYPATGVSPVINEDGKFLSQWLANLSNHTLVCFHSKTVVRLPDGRIQATSNLFLTRVERSIDATPSEAYAGPVYGPPVVHRVSHEATFVFDLPAPDGKGRKDGVILATGSTKIFREDFPPLLKAAVNTYWPPVIQDKSCANPYTGGGEGYYGPKCTGTLLEAPGLPEAPVAANAEDIGTASNFNAVVGNRLDLLVHLRLLPKDSGEPLAGGV